MGNIKEQKGFAVLNTETPMMLDPSQSSSQDFRNKPPGKGKGKRQPKGRKEKAKGSVKGKGKRTPSRSNSSNPQNGFSFQAHIQCKHCGSTKHYSDHSYQRFPHLRPKRSYPRSPRSNSQSRHNSHNSQNSNTPQVTFQLPPSTFEADEQFDNKKRKVNILTTLALSLTAKVNGRAVETIVDSDASMSVVAAGLVDSNRIYRTQSVPVQVAPREIIFELGTTD